ncbi:hypothetical protein [Nocardia beijingensis]
MFGAVRQKGSTGERRTIAIVGGIHPCGVMDRPSWTEDDGAPAAHEIGAELARADYDLFVYSSAQRFVERDVVAGIQYRRLPGNTEA